MKIAEILKKMITFSNGNIHDIDHLIKVWTYAKTIGELEGSIQRHSLFWRLPPSPMTSPALSVVKNMEMPMENIRKSKAHPGNRVSFRYGNDHRTDQPRGLSGRPPSHPY